MIVKGPSIPLWFALYLRTIGTKELEPCPRPDIVFLFVVCSYSRLMWPWDTDMIFVKTFTLADFGHVIFYPETRNSLESWNSSQFKTCAQTSLSIEAFRPIYSIRIELLRTDQEKESQYWCKQHEYFKPEIQKGLTSTSVWKNFSTSNGFTICQFHSFKIIYRSVQ